MSINNGFMKIYEELNMKNTKTSIRKARAKKPLKEARSVKDIEAEIARLQQELESAKVAEKKASYSELPVEVWVWDICRAGSKHNRKWTSAELYSGKWNGIVFETEAKAIDAGWILLGELENEGELPGGRYAEADDFDVEAFSVKTVDVDENTLYESDLAHLVGASPVTTPTTKVKYTCGVRTEAGAVSKQYNNEKADLKDAVADVVEYINKLSSKEKEDFELEMTDGNGEFLVAAMSGLAYSKSAVEGKNYYRTINNGIDNTNWVEGAIRNALGLKAIN